MREMLDARRLQVLASALGDLVGIEHQIGAVRLWTMIHGRFSGSDAHLSYSASSICHIQRLREHHPPVASRARVSPNLRMTWTRRCSMASYASFTPTSQVELPYGWRPRREVVNSTYQASLLNLGWRVVVRKPPARPSQPVFPLRRRTVRLQVAPEAGAL